MFGPAVEWSQHVRTLLTTLLSLTVLAVACPPQLASAYSPLNQIGREGTLHVEVYTRAMDTPARVWHGAQVHIWQKWLNRRSQQRSMPWTRFLRLLARYPLPRMTAAHFATGG